MNSPDPGSPISTDTESPSLEEINIQPSSSSNFGASQIAQTLVGGSKRRLPGGTSVGAPFAMRDPKMRRKIEQAKGANVNVAAGWDSSKETKRDERDLVDHHIVDYLRKEIGDPFQDTAIHEQS